MVDAVSGPVDQGAIRAVAALDDDLRRGMYTFVRQARRPVTRDEAAAAVGISRKLAAFHLEKLVDAGLLRYGMDARGAPRKVGRRPKVYEPAGSVQVAIPARRYDLLADILLDAVLGQAQGEQAREVAIRVATERGERIGAAERDRLRPGRLGAERALTFAQTLLAGYGFEPHRDSPTTVTLGNCPFHSLAERAPALVCALNRALVQGILTGFDVTTVEAGLAPAPGRCCVELAATASRERNV
ncbi:helix-turn-helix transcriptional regulator [Amycolatopsis pigmentata]|uniref:Helix-turn-helix transcriptional regulator n=1 Tax=Amycolatopsis pigmentata TaxID=450801 RepID=A0ABW5G4W7_9PSEU